VFHAIDVMFKTNFGKSTKNETQGRNQTIKIIFSNVFGKDKTLRIFAPSFADRSATQSITKRILQCQVKREHINLQREKEETNTVSESVWLLLMEEKFLPEEELKEERN